MDSAATPEQVIRGRIQRFVESVCSDGQPLDAVLADVLAEGAAVTLNQTPRAAAEIARRLRDVRNTVVSPAVDIHALVSQGSWMGVDLTVKAPMLGYLIKRTEFAVVARLDSSAQVEEAHVVYRPGYALEGEGWSWHLPAYTDGQGSSEVSAEPGTASSDPPTDPSMATVPVEEYLREFTEETFREEIPVEDLYDKFFTRDAVHWTNGSKRGRGEIVKQMRRGRSKAVSYTVDLRTVVDDGRAYAARYDMKPSRPGANFVVTEFGWRGVDGRILRIRSLVQNTNGTWSW